MFWRVRFAPHKTLRPMERWVSGTSAAAAAETFVSEVERDHPVFDVIDDPTVSVEVREHPGARPELMTVRRTIGYDARPLYT